MEISSIQQTLTLKKLFIETTRIIKSQARVFLVLSFLFLLPLSAAKLIYPKIVHNFLLSTLLGKHNTTTQGISHVYSSELHLLGLFLFLFSYLFSPCAIASLTYTAFRSFNDEPTKINHAIKSISASYLPLLATMLLSQSIIFTFAFIFTNLVFPLRFFAESVAALSTSLATFMIFFPAVAFFVLLIHLQVIWTAAYPIVVVESKWGFKALARSNTIIKGKTGLVWAWSLMIIAVISIVLWRSNSLVVNRLVSYLDGGDDHYDLWGFWLCFWLSVASLMLIQLYTTIANTVLYVYCKGVSNIGGYEFTGKYTILPVKEDNVASIV